METAEFAVKIKLRNFRAVTVAGIGDRLGPAFAVLRPARFCKARIAQPEAKREADGKAVLVVVSIADLAAFGVDFIDALAEGFMTWYILIADRPGL